MRKLAFGIRRKTDTLTYSDDVILFTETIEDHLYVLRRMLGNFVKAGLNGNPKSTDVSVQCSSIFNSQVTQTQQEYPHYSHTDEETHTTDHTSERRVRRFYISGAAERQRIARFFIFAWIF